MRVYANWVVSSLPALDVAMQAGILTILVYRDVAHTRTEFLSLLLLLPILGYMLRRFGVYDSHRMDGRWSVLRKIVSAHLTASLLCASLLIITGQGAILSQVSFFFAISMTTLALICEPIRGI